MVLLELLGEATAGVLVEELLETVGELGRSVTGFKRAAGRLQKTLLLISPLIKHIENQNHAVGREPEVLQFLADFRESLEEGQKFVCKCLKNSGCQILKRPLYKKRLDELDESLRRFREDMQFLTTRDAIETLLLVKRIHLCLPVLTKLTVSIIQKQQIRVLEVYFYDPTCIDFRRPYECPLEGRSTGWFDSVRGEICMGQIQITVDHELIVRRKFYSGESNEYRIDLDSGVFDGHLIAFGARRRGIAYGQGIACDPEWFDDGSIRRDILYEGLAWGENLREQSIRRGSATMRLGSEGLHSSLPWIPSCTIPPWTPSLSERIAVSEIQNELCYCGRRASLRHPNSENSSRSFHNCEENKCHYFEYYLPMENETSTTGEVASHDNFHATMEIETSAEVASHGNSHVPMENEISGAGVVASHDNSYAPMENETCAAGEVVSHDGSFNSDNREKENDDTEEMSRKCLKEQLHVLQGTVNGQKLLIATCVMVCFLSLIMNFVILMYKCKGLCLKFELGHSLE